MKDVPSESNRVRRLLRERFTFQISLDTRDAHQGLAVAEAALKAGATILELGTPLLKTEGVRNVIPIFRRRFPEALLLADMKTMDGGGGEANAVFGGGANLIGFLALAGEATARAVCAARDTFRQSFFASCPSMVDYLHLEIVRTLANDDPQVLGKDYPGPMV